MNTNPQVQQSQIDKAYARLSADAEASGYHLNPDAEFTRELIEGLLVNELRYGYWNCPCRLATGDKAKDLDIICPCDYRDADINEYSNCFCGLYVSDAIKKGTQKTRTIPERRPKPKAPRPGPSASPPPVALKTTLPVWRCKVCGYLCGRETPPEKCPICKAGKERFEKFIW